MTRKTWPLLLGSFVIPALLIAACSSDTDDDDDADDGGKGNTTDTSGTGATKNSNPKTGVGNSNSGGGSNRFTAPSTAGGVYHRGGASAGGRSNQFNTAGAVSKAGSGNLAGSAGTANAGAAGLTGSGGASATTSSSAPPPNGGTTATGGTSAVAAAGAAGASAICPDGCAAIAVALGNSSTADYAFLTPSSIDYSNASVTLSANVYAPGATVGRVRLLVENASGSDACRSDWVNLSSLASQFTAISETKTGCTIANAAKVAIRLDNNTGSNQTLKIYLTSLTLTSTTPAQNLSWTSTGSASIDSSPDTSILGPDNASANATLSYLND